jgi:membrane-bound lytic murein transglycosylase B
MVLGSALALAIAVLWTRSDDEPTGDSPSSTVVEAPPAVAPPDPGVDPPLLGMPVLTGPNRPQAQFDNWAASMSDDLNIPKAALEAYGYAARDLQTRRPHCGLSWPLLAGIGSVESSHGRYGGARLDATGRPTVPIRGLALDGGEGVKRIADTDAGALDGDPVFDRAVGPLQFIPSTWKTWGRDADADGVADPHDIDDAALSAGDYLCSAGGDLRQPDRFWAALLTYNESRSYGQEVLDRADLYGRSSHAAAGAR